MGFRAYGVRVYMVQEGIGFSESVGCMGVWQGWDAWGGGGGGGVVRADGAIACAEYGSAGQKWKLQRYMLGP